MKLRLALQIGSLAAEFEVATKIKMQTPSSAVKVTQGATRFGPKVISRFDEDEEKKMQERLDKLLRMYSGEAGDEAQAATKHKAILEGLKKTLKKWIPRRKFPHPKFSFQIQANLLDHDGS